MSRQRLKPSNIEPNRIEPGIYRLVIAVDNPAPDRRSQSDWHKRPSWPMGSMYVVFGNPNRPLMTDEELAELAPEERIKLEGLTRRSLYQRIECVGERHTNYIQPYVDPEAWNALTSNLVPVRNPSWEAYWASTNNREFLSSDFLRWLVARKYITRGQLQEEFQMWQDAPEPEDE